MAAKPRQRKPTTSQTVTTGTTIRIETPKSKRQPKTPVAKVVVQELSPVGGFVDFLREHAIVGLSSGFIIGTQMAAFVKILVENFIDPLTKLLFGTALSQRTFTLQFHHRLANFGWGVVVYNLLIILLLLIFIYATIKFFSLEELDKPKEKKS
jgi:large-conductance mechanosensitive channel